MLLVRHILICAFFLIGTARLAGQSVSISADVTEGCDSVIAHFTATPAGLGSKTVQNYLWRFGDGTSTSTTSNTSIKKYLVAGIYTARLEMTLAGDDGIYTATAQIYVRPHPNANFYVADTFQLSPLTYHFLSGIAPIDTIAYRYVWTLNPDSLGNYDYRRIHSTANYITPGHGSGNIKRDTLLYTFVLTGSNVMRLQVTDYFGCSDTYQQYFYVSEKLFIPTVFTPNGDHINDFFIVQTNGRSVFSFKVFSLTGQLIFKSESLSIIWDGKMSNGSDAWPGTYFYVIESISGEPVKRQAGFFMLFR
jgi:gliding motility-associated-like protein